MSNPRTASAPNITFELKYKKGTGKPETETGLRGTIITSWDAGLRFVLLWTPNKNEPEEERSLKGSGSLNAVNKFAYVNDACSVDDEVTLVFGTVESGRGPGEIEVKLTAKNRQDPSKVLDQVFWLRAGAEPDSQYNRGGELQKKRVYGKGRDEAGHYVIDFRAKQTS